MSKTLESNLECNTGVMERMLKSVQNGGVITPSEAFLLIHRFGHELSIESFYRKMMAIKVQDMMNGESKSSTDNVTLAEILKIAEACNEAEAEAETEVDKNEEEKKLIIEEGEWNILE